MDGRDKEFYSIASIPEIHLLGLFQDVQGLQNRMKTSDLGNVEFVRQANLLLSRVLIDSHQTRLASGDMAGDLTGMRMLSQVQEHALKVKELLRQSALKLVISSNPSTNLRDKLETAILFLSLSLSKLYKYMEANGWTENGEIVARPFLPPQKSRPAGSERP